MNLFIVPTPIGNLEDASFRSIRILNEVQQILAEDTRTTSKLLRHYNITTKLRPFHSFNEHKQLQSVIREIKSGVEMALVSDAGMPGISDPGFLLIRECVSEGIEIECLPGSSAVLPAVVSSGIPPNRFAFEGFLPVKKGRKSRLEELKDEKRTLVFFESPHRLLKTLEDFISTFGGDRLACVSREISKLHEQHHRDSLQKLLEYFQNTPPKGEIVITVAGAD